MLNDIRYAFRTLRQHPGFAATAIISIALGIGANSATFSFVDALLFRPLPARDASRLVSIRSLAPSTSASSLAETNMEISYPDFEDIRARSRSFDGFIAYDLRGFGFARDERAQAQMQLGYLVTGNFLEVLGLEPALGRTFGPEEDVEPGRDAVVMLSYQFWRQQFGGDPAVIGNQVRLNGMPFTVIGVAPQRFTGLEQFIRPAFFVPLMMVARLDPAVDLLHRRDLRDLDVKGRLKADVSIDAANAEITGIARALEESHPSTNRGFGTAVRTELEIRRERTGYGPIVAALFTLVGLVLLIACCNVANLMLVRGKARIREIALRLAIGAGRARLVRQLMIENLLIGLGGGVVGLLVAQVAVEYFSSFEIVGDTPIQFGFEIDSRVLLFTLLVSIGSAVLFGVVPAFYSTKTDLSTALKAGPPQLRRSRMFGRSALVVAQIAASMVILIGAAQAYRESASFIGRRGFRTDHLLTVRIDTALAGYSIDRSQQFFIKLLEQIRSMASVKSAALTYSLPLTTTLRQETLIPEGYAFPANQKNVTVMSSSVDEAYFETQGIPVVSGRGFVRTDTANSPPVAIVNQVFAQQYFGGDPIGKRIRLGNETGPWLEIVGMTATAKYLSIAEPPTPFLYLPVSQQPQQRLTVLVESTDNPSRLAAPIRELLRSIDPNVAILDIRTMDDLFEHGTVRALTVVLTMFGTLGLIGLVLAIVGLYAIVAYQVEQRTREIGIRMALGAAWSQVVRMILRSAAFMSLAGIGIGFVLTFALRNVLNGGSTPQPVDWFVFAGVPLTLLFTALIATALPARRASRVDPQQALRQE